MRGLRGRGDRLAELAPALHLRELARVRCRVRRLHEVAHRARVVCGRSGASGALGRAEACACASACAGLCGADLVSACSGAVAVAGAAASRSQASADGVGWDWFVASAVVVASTELRLLRLRQGRRRWLRDRLLRRLFGRLRLPAWLGGGACAPVGVLAPTAARLRLRRLRRGNLGLPPRADCRPAIAAAAAAGGDGSRERWRLSRRPVAAAGVAGVSTDCRQRGVDGDGCFVGGRRSCCQPAAAPARACAASLARRRRARIGLAASSSACSVADGLRCAGLRRGIGEGSSSRFAADAGRRCGACGCAAARCVGLSMRRRCAWRVPRRRRSPPASASRTENGEVGVLGLRACALAGSGRNAAASERWPWTPHAARMHLSTRNQSRSAVQSAGHAPEFEKLPKFQWLVIRSGGPDGGCGRHDLLACGKNCRAAATDAMARGQSL